MYIETVEISAKLILDLKQKIMVPVWEKGDFALWGVLHKFQTPQIVSHFFSA